MPSQRRRQLATDLALIGLNVRTAYLVDVVACQNPVVAFSTILQSLRQKLSIFTTVVHLYEPSSEQSFFLNVPLFLDAHATPNATAANENSVSMAVNSSRTSFVLLTADGPPKLLSQAPADVVATIEDMRIQLIGTTTSSESSDVPLSITLAPNLTPRVTVPLAAILLEYPVAYVPSSSDPEQATFFLSRVTMDVYQCILTWHHSSKGSTSLPKPIEHTLLKFSCPSDLTAKDPDRCDPRPPRILAGLASTFDTRLERLEAGPKLAVRHTTETLDRVAL